MFNEIPVRFNVAVMFFMACFVSYLVRVNLSVSIIAMVKHQNDTDLTDYGPRYDWDGHTQALILGAFFWGYLTTSLFGGIISEWYSGRYVIFFTFLFAALFTALSPFAASHSFWAMFLMRYLIGFVNGVLYPSIHHLVSRWAPNEEKGKFVATLLGGSIGTVVTWSSVGVITEKFGWKWGFYVSAIFALFIALIWLLIVFDRPGMHPRISKKERDYIESSLGESVNHERQSIPMLSILKSIPFWALLFAHYGNDWGLYFILTVGPKYISEILKFSIANAGFLSAIPYVTRTIAGLIFGQIGDYLRQKNILSVTTIRKSFIIFSHIIPAFFLIGMGHVENPYVSVVLMTLSLGFNGAVTQTNGQNPQDLAPNFAGTLYGLINFVGTTSGFISPLLVAYFTKEDNTAEAWRNVFYVGASVYICTGLVFIIFGSGKIQKWNDVPTKKSKNITDTKL